MTELREAFAASLLCDYAAGYAVAGVAGGIGLHVVGFCVDDDRRAAVAEERVRAVAQGYVGVLEGSIGFAVGADGQVQHVAGVMAFGVLQSVLLAVGIEVRACGFKIGSIALGVLVDVDAVLAGREVVKSKLEADT